jgi:hypothetical protein
MLYFIWPIYTEVCWFVKEDSDNMCWNDLVINGWAVLLPINNMMNIVCGHYITAGIIYSF